MIPFYDLKKINQPYNKAIELAVSRVLASGWYIAGHELNDFEKSFAEFCNADHCVGVANGSDAIMLIFKAYNFPVGSEVIVPANTYIASVLPLCNLGLVPVLVEPDPATLLIDPDNIEEHITESTRAILTVDLYGKSCDIERIRRIADIYKLKIVTDAAQAHGALRHGKKVGSVAHATAFSFYPTKNLGALGDAGAVTTNSSLLAEKVRYLRNYGSKIRYMNEYQGVNSRMDEMQAAVLLAKLPYLNASNERRRVVARKYADGLKLKGLQLPPFATIEEDAWHLFVVRHPERNRLREYLLTCGIETDIHYPIPVHHQKAFPDWNKLSLPITESIHREVLSLPLNPALTEAEITLIIESINAFQ